MQRQQEPLFLAEDGTYVDVTNFVRFELNHDDIRYGVLDLVVQFPYKGQRVQCYSAFLPGGRSYTKCQQALL